MTCDRCGQEGARQRTSAGELIGRSCAQIEAADKARALRRMTRNDYIPPTFQAGGLEWEVAK